MRYEPTFQKYLDFGRRLSAFYMDGRYPPGPIEDYFFDDIKYLVSITDEIIVKILSLVNQ